MIPASPAQKLLSVGYLTVVEDPQFGFIGGLLVVSSLGRPLEFHCSTPLVTSRAQQILYGPTLRPHVCGEVIANALLATAKISPTVLLLEDAAALPPSSSATTLLVVEPVDDASGAVSADNQRAVNIGSNRLVVVGKYEGDPSRVREILETLASHVAISEPFERVHEAIREAQRLSSGEAVSDAA